MQARGRVGLPMEPTTPTSRAAAVRSRRKTSEVPVNIAPGGRLFLDEQTRRLQALGLLLLLFAVG